jgi:RHS repeat-associated protein
VETRTGATWWEWWQTQTGIVTMSGTTVNYAMWAAPEGGTASISGSTYYLHKDWLGNARIVSNTGTNTYTTDRAYTPYGETFAAFGNTAATQFDVFAGTTGDFNIGVQWETPNRELSIVGRWLSPDPAGFGWNQYAYPTNPNSFVDPSGLCQFDSDPCGSNDAHGSQSEDRDFTNYSAWTVNGVQVSGTVAGNLLSMDAAMLCPSGCGPDSVRLGSQGQWQIWVGSTDPNPACTTGADICVGRQGTWMNAYWTAPDDTWHSTTPAGTAHNNSNQGFTKYHCDLFGTCYQGPQINRRDPAKAIKWYLCGNGSFNNIKNYTLEGLGKGAVFGGLFGSEFGPEGTFLGVAGGAIEGFFSGNAVGWVAATACQAAGMYGPRS